MNFLKKLATNKGDGAPGQVHNKDHLAQQHMDVLDERVHAWRGICAEHVEQLAEEVRQGVQLQHEGGDQGGQEHRQVCSARPTAGKIPLFRCYWKIKIY